MTVSDLIHVLEHRDPNEIVVYRDFNSSTTYSLPFDECKPQAPLTWADWIKK